MEVAGEIRVSELNMGQRASIARPDLVLFIHPGRYMSRSRSRAVVFDGEAHPWCVASLDRVDYVVEFFMVGVRRGFGGIAVGGEKKQASDKLEKFVNLALGHLHTLVKESGEFELDTVIEWSPIERAFVEGRRSGTGWEIG